MDVLSELLRKVRLEGALFFNAEFSSPWCISSPPSETFVPFFRAGPGRMVLFHFLTEGRAYVRLTDGQQVELTAGDIVILAQGDAHFLGNGSPVRPVDGLQALADNLSAGLKLARYGGGGEVTRFVCGYLACDGRLSDLFMASLPRLMKVHVSGDPSGQWLEHAIRFTVDNGGGAAAGGGLVIAKLSEVLFVETLRRYINALPPEQTGWLAGTRDEAIGEALTLLHQDPAKPWTISSLAKSVGLSRTRLAERFRHFLGESPMAYLAQWRLKVSAEVLQTSDESVASVAASVGYGSEAAFNRAFKREFDCPPAKYRRQRKARQHTDG